MNYLEFEKRVNSIGGKIEATIATYISNSPPTPRYYVLVIFGTKFCKLGPVDKETEVPKGLVEFLKLAEQKIREEQLINGSQITLR